MVTGSYPGGPASHPAPCLWPEKAVKDGPNLGTLHPRGRPERNSWLLISDRLSSSHRGPKNGKHLGVIFHSVSS